MFQALMHEIIEIRTVFISNLQFILRWTTILNVLGILIPVIYLFDSKYIITECVQFCFQDIVGKFFPFKSSVPGDILEYLTIVISLFLFLKGSKRQEGSKEQMLGQGVTVALFKYFIGLISVHLRYKA